MHKIENLDRDDFGGDVMLSNDAAARLIGIGGRTLRRMRAKGAGPSYRMIGNHVIYPHSAVLVFIATSTVDVRPTGSLSRTLRNGGHNGIKA
jgi:hypothetical protein